MARTAPTRPLSQDTRDKLVEAIVRETLTKSLSSVTITELCNAAGVSRMTFYRNFDSKEAILKSKIDDLVEEYRRLTTPYYEEGKRWDSEDYMCSYFRFMRENSQFIDCLFRCGCSMYVQEAIAGFINGTWGDGSVEYTFVLYAFAGSLCASYQFWADRDFEDEPEYMAMLLSRFFDPEPNPVSTGC